MFENVNMFEFNHFFYPVSTILLMAQGGRMFESVDMFEVENHDELLPHHARSLPGIFLKILKTPL